MSSIVYKQILKDILYPKQNELKMPPEKKKEPVPTKMGKRERSMNSGSYHLIFGVAGFWGKKTAHPPKSIETTDADPLTPQVQSWMWPVRTKPAEKKHKNHSGFRHHSILTTLKLGPRGGARGSYLAESRWAEPGITLSPGKPKEDSYPVHGIHGT